MRNKIFLPLLVSALFITLSASAQTSTNENSVATEKQELKTIKLKVGGINCSADCKDIQGSVSKISGVTACTLKGKPGATTSFEVTFNPMLVSEKDIRKAVEGTAGCSDPDSRPYKVKG